MKRLLCGILQVAISIPKIMLRDIPTALVDVGSIALALLVLILTANSKDNLLNYFAIGAIDAIILFWIFCAAVLSTDVKNGGFNHAPRAQRENVSLCLPTRPGAFIILSSFLSVIILTFANIHWGISIENSAAYFNNNKDYIIKDYFDAIYISFGTMFTLSTVTPKSESAKIAVIVEFVSGIGILVAALPLLVGRLGMWDNTDVESRTSGSEKKLTIDDLEYRLGIFASLVFIVFFIWVDWRGF